MGRSQVPGGPQIQQAVPWSAVETGHAAVARQDAQVGDAAKIDRDAVFGGVREYGGVKSGHQWRALSAGSDVAAAKIGHHAHAGEFGQKRRVADLRGVAALGPVAHGLAMAADGADLGSRGFRLGENIGDRLRIAFRQFVAGKGSAVNLVRSFHVQRKECVSQRGIKGQMGIGKQPGPGAA